MTDPVVEIRVEGLPLSLLASAQEHIDDLLREFALIAGGHRAGSPEFPQRLVTLFNDLDREYAEVGDAQRVQIERAAGTGADVVDLVLAVPASASEACARLDEALDEADRYCRDGEYLLSLLPSAELREFRHWYLAEIARQLHGEAPTPWPDYAAEHGVTGVDRTP